MNADTKGKESGFLVLDVYLRLSVFICGSLVSSQWANSRVPRHREATPIARTGVG